MVDLGMLAFFAALIARARRGFVFGSGPLTRNNQNIVLFPSSSEIVGVLLTAVLISLDRIVRCLFLTLSFFALSCLIVDHLLPNSQDSQQCVLIFVPSNPHIRTNGLTVSTENWRSVSRKGDKCNEKGSREREICERDTVKGQTYELKEYRITRCVHPLYMSHEQWTDALCSAEGSWRRALHQTISSADRGRSWHAPYLPRRW
jgi:hypothetical protein